MSALLVVALVVTRVQGEPNAVVVEQAVITAPATHVARALVDVASWPVLFRDIERVERVRAAQGIVYGRVKSSTTGLHHDIEVRHQRGRVFWRVDEGKGFVVFDILEVERAAGAVTHLTVRARTHIYGPVKIVLSDGEITSKLRAVVRADVEDLLRRFGGDLFGT